MHCALIGILSVLLKSDSVPRRLPDSVTMLTRQGGLEVDKGAEEETNAGIQTLPAKFW